MAQMWVLVIALTILASTTQLSEAKITEEDIRDAILSLSHVLRSTEDKLERHEYRERALGEQLKNNLGTIDKRQRLLEPMRGTLGRLDERLAHVETILIQNDERERIQLQKTADAVEEMQTTIPTWMETILEVIKEDKTPTTSTKEKTEIKDVDGITKTDLQTLQKEMFSRTDKMVDMLVKMQGQINSMEEDRKKFKTLDEKSTESIGKLEKQLKNSEQLLEKYENRLAELNNRVVPTEVQQSNSKAKSEWQTNFLQALEMQRTNLEQILSDVRTVSDKVGKLPDTAAIQNAKNETLENIQQLKYESGLRADKTVIKIENKLKEIRDEYNGKHDDLYKSVGEIAERMETSNGVVAKSYDQLKTEIQALSKVEKVLLQTADNIMDTKRRVEYGVHQILLEVGDLVKGQSKELNATMNERFDNIELYIFESQSGSLANLTTKLESEISQVWRQIGIMYTQLSASTTALDRLQAQTDVYVNGSLSTMDSMESKVIKITGRMTEVDENLNFLLGRLSLVTQEFNHIKTGLVTALDSIRSSFGEVNNKLNNVGPGPHKIPLDVPLEEK